MTRRERYREQTRADAKRIALAQLAAGGQEGLSLNAIAREMGMSGPALYRYFANRDELLTALIVDAYNDVGATVATAVADASQRGPGARLRALAHAMRAWALDQPHRYLLLFGTPFAGYHAPEAASEAARDSIGGVMLTMIDIHGERPARNGGRTTLERELERAPWVPEEMHGRVPGDVLADTLLTWSRIHGLIGLEINGQFAQMGFDPALLFERELDAIVAADDRSGG